MLTSSKTVCGVPIASLSPSSERRVRLECDVCGRFTETTFANYNAGQKKNQSRGMTKCRWCAVRASGIAKRGKPIKKTERPNFRRENSPQWKGGRFVGSDGYVKVYVGPRKYRKEHFLVMERKLGRELRPGEVVHHIDTDKVNNLPDNLTLLRNESEHQLVHNTLRSVVRMILRSGLVKYNRKTKSYEAVGKLRELLEQPGGADQQPSRSGDARKVQRLGDESQWDGNSPTSAQRRKRR